MQDSYVSMITSYSNTVHLDDDKIIATAIAERRSLHLQDLVFKNKATKSWLQTLSTNSSDMCLRNYFGVMYTSAET